ncbi:MAG TPA: Hsp20/alpha crystallin family protein [Verrucomicrobiae bacterium]|jgi:HSP20 family protein
MCKLSSSYDFPRLSGSETVKRTAEGHWVPNTDAWATDDGLVIKVELAGLRREDLELTVEGNALRISGHRADGCRTGNCNFLIMEINYGAFASVIEMPEGYDLSQARASYENGFLRIDVPRSVERKVKATISEPSGKGA